MLKKVIFQIMLIICVVSSAHCAAPIKKGNFSLPDSQIPATLLGIGQFTIENNQQQFFISPNYLRGQNLSLAGI